MRTGTEKFPSTYAFKGITLFRSFSTLIPDATDENPHAYKRFAYDEVDDCVDEWEKFEVLTPLAYDTATKE